VCICDLHLVALGIIVIGVLVTLGDCHHLDGLELMTSLKHARRLCGAQCSGGGFVKGIVLTPWGSRKAILLDCMCH
jgi:hypothetical protein